VFVFCAGRPGAQAQALAAKLRAAQVTTGAQMRQLASFDAGVQVRRHHGMCFFPSVRRVRLTVLSFL
jgi:hypothetical protein